jgi:hypothetical protein
MIYRWIYRWAYRLGLIMTEWAAIALESVARGRKDDDLVCREGLSEMDTQSRYLAACTAMGREEDLVSDI